MKSSLYKQHTKKALHLSTYIYSVILFRTFCIFPVHRLKPQVLDCARKDVTVSMLSEYKSQVQHKLSATARKGMPGDIVYGKEWERGTVPISQLTFIP